MDVELKWLLFLIVMAFDGLFLAAVITKYVEVKRASIWAAVPGRIVTSRSEARRIRTMSAAGARKRIHDTELRNFAVVTYAFDADGRRQQGQRISLSADVGNYQVAEKLKRYPVGANVTVYYDRNRPSDSVLERDIPTRTFEIAILAGMLVGVVSLFLLLISDDVMAGLSRLVPNSTQSSAALFVAVLAALIVAFGYRLHHKGAQTRTWPSTSGLVLSSDVVAVKVGRPYRWWRLNARRLIRDRTTYSYTVDGVTYRSDRTSFGAQTYATFSFFARRAADRFVPGNAVEVFYNPKSPAEAVLVRGAPGQMLIWIAGAAMFGLAARLAGLL